jgi:hypothetical protein
MKSILVPAIPPASVAVAKVLNVNALATTYGLFSAIKIISITQAIHH